MEKPVTCFVPYHDDAQAADTVAALRRQAPVGDIFLLDEPIRSTAALREIAARAKTPYTLLFTKFTSLDFILFSIERMIEVQHSTGAAMVYADRFFRRDGVDTPAPVIDCQLGSLRDDFDFGPVTLWRTDALQEAVSRMTTDYQYAGLYDLRLKVSQKGSLEHINEFLYYDVETDTRKSGEKQFDYVDPKNRAVQIEMEAAVTDHLKAIGGYLAPVFKSVDFGHDDFAFDASVVIPCRNRVRTIGDAIASALNQKTKYKYNVIVVDDNSTDGTVDVIKRFLTDNKLIYISKYKLDRE